MRLVVHLLGWTLDLDLGPTPPHLAGGTPAGESGPDERPRIESAGGSFGIGFAPVLDEHPTIT